MIWELKLTHIVMLTNCMEHGRVKKNNCAVSYTFITIVLFSANVNSTGLKV